MYDALASIVWNCGPGAVGGAKVLAAGGSVLTEPFDIYDAGRMAVLADPDGAVCSASRRRARIAARRSSTSRAR